jgi:protein-disulfide isomerase
MKNIIIWTTVVVIAIVSLLIWGREKTPSIEPPFEVGVLHPLDKFKGSPNAKVLVVEYSDFQCPACKAYYPLVRQMVQEFGSEITFVYRNFPLTSIHFNAEFAARAAESAGKQNKFWEMHDLLFEKQSEWSNTSNVIELFESYARLLSLDIDQFRTDFASREIKEYVRIQRRHATSIGVDGTPSFFINGKQIQNPTTVDEFRKTIREAINSSQQ